MRVVLASLVLLAAPATASAAIGEVEPLKLRGDEDCVHAPGAPGEIVVPTRDGVRFVRATREGLEPGATVTLGGPRYDCARTVTTASGAGVVVARGPSVAVFRDPGGGWGAPVKLPVADGWDIGILDAAVSDRGDTLIVWREDREREGSAGSYRFRAARRAPGGTLGPAEVIGEAGRQNELILPAIAATGEAFVLTTVVLGTKPPLDASITVTSAAAGAPFGEPIVIGRMPWLSTPSMVAASDGRVLVAWPDGRFVHATERAPGGYFDTFATVATTPPRTWFVTSASLGAGGEATIAWVNAATGEAGLAVRAAPGPFGTPQRIPSPALVGARYDPFFASQTFISTFLGTAGLSFGEGQYGATALAPGGQGLFAWYRDQRQPAAPALVTRPLAGGPAVSASGGRGLTTPSTSFPVVLADGAPGMAWIENTDTSPSANSSRPYRLRFAAEGVAPRASAPTPRVTVGPPRRRVLSDEATLRLPVRCSGPCEVRGEIVAGQADVFGTLRLGRAGTGTLAIRGAAIGLAGPRGRVRVVLSYRTPGALEAESRTLRVALARPAGTPDMRVRGVRAVRRGDTVRVTWRVARPDPESMFFVTGAATRDLAREPETFRHVRSRRDRREYAVTLPASADVRFAMVRSFESIVSGRPAIVPVR